MEYDALVKVVAPVVIETSRSKARVIESDKFKFSNSGARHIHI